MEITKLPKIIHYDLNFTVEPKENYLSVNGKMIVKNDTDVLLDNINILLYHSLSIESVFQADCKLNYAQSIRSLSDEENYRVNFVNIVLEKALKPFESTELKLEYCGNINGYSHLMRYIQDSITEDFSIIRPDSHTYPIISQPDFKSIIENSFNTFTYNIAIIVPYEYTAASGGILKEVKRINDRNIYYYYSPIPTWRFDIAIAQYQIVEDRVRNLRIYVFPEHKAFAEEVVVKEINRVFTLYTELFGRFREDKYFTVIEIKETYGAQEGDNYITMEEHGFTSMESMSHLYHEIGHIWNVSAKYDVQRTRFFDEAFACYFEALALKRFYGIESFLDKMESYRLGFIKSVDWNKVNYDTPICDYGKSEIGYNSYTKGPWVLYLLNEILGDEIFIKMISAFLFNYQNMEVTFSEFEKIVQKYSISDMRTFFNDWIYGIESSKYLYENLSIKEMVQLSIGG